MCVYIYWIGKENILPAPKKRVHKGTKTKPADKCACVCMCERKKREEVNFPKQTSRILIMVIPFFRSF